MYLTYLKSYANINVKLTLHIFVTGVSMNNRVKEIRKQKGIKQDEFARALGVSRQTVSSIETGRFDPSIMLAYKIAKIFELSIEEVFIFEDEQ